MGRTIRVTMFKIPDKDNVQKFLDLYRKLITVAVKDGKPYILSLAAGPAHEDARSQGYTLVAKSEFKDVADMNYYDTECEAHKDLKANAKGLGVEGAMVVYYDPEVEFGN